MANFLHLKFASGRPPPVAANIPWAHEVDPARDPLHETIKADTQREGLVRHLQQNFPAGSYVHDVVHEREGDAGMYILCTKNWARSVGDPKLHLSLYVYQEDSHCATWHAYTDRSISYSRDGDEADPPPEGADPYSTPDALAAAASRAPSPMPPPKDDDRPRFDRPAAAPDSDEDAVEEPFQPAELLSPRPAAAASARSRRSKKPEPVESGSETEDEPPTSRPVRERNDKPAQARESPSPAEANEQVVPSPPAQQRSSRSSRRRSPSLNDASESEGEPAEPDVDLSKPAYPMLKSKPLGRPSTRARQLSLSRSPPPPPPTRSSRSARRARSPSPEPPERERPAASPSSSRSPSPIPAPRSSRRAEPATQDRERQRSRRRQPEKDESPSRSPSPPPSKPASARSSRKPRAVSPEPASADDRRSRSASPPARTYRGAVAVPASRGAEQVEDVADHGPRRRPSPSRSPSPTRSPPPRASRSTRRERNKAAESAVKEAPRRARSTSRSPSPPSRTARRSRSSPQRSRLERDNHAEHAERDELPVDHERSGRSSTRPAPPPTPSAPPLDRTPSWRSVSRNRHRREDSDDDTLVRGNMDDPELDVPAGGEVSLLEAKRRSASKDRSARRPRARDQGFDPAVVAQPPPAPPKQTAGALLGGWVKSVVALVKTEGELAGSEVKEKMHEVEEETEEARLKRKEERMKRRAARAARRAARADSEAQLDAAEASQARTQRKALEHAADERKAHERDDKVRAAAEGRLEKAPAREPQSGTTRPCASSRRPSPSRSASDSEPAPPPRPRRVEPAEPDRAQVRSSRHRHRGSSNVDSPSELGDEPEPPRPTPRQRAMSVSATVESGLRGIRDSVTKMVSGAHDVEHAVNDKLHHRATTSSRIKHETRRRHVEPDGDGERDQPGRSDRSRRPTIAVETGGDSHRAARRHKPAASPVGSPVAQHRHERPRAPSSRPHDSDSTEGPPRRLARVAPQEPPSPCVDSESDTSELPSRPSSRLTVRSESEGDGPRHRLAKLDAALNAVPPEPVQPPRSARLALVPDSPSAAHGPRSSSPSRPLDHTSQHGERRPIGRGRRFVDELKDDVERFERKVVAEVPTHTLSHGARQRRGADDVRPPRHGDSLDALQGHGRAAPPPTSSGSRRPAAHVPLDPPHASIPPIPSPLSPGASHYPYGYDRSSFPIRPEPVKPSSYVAALQQKRIPPPSSVGSSDEGDLSRPASAIRRTRSGYLTASGSEQDDGHSGGSSAFEPEYGHAATDSEREAPASRAHEQDRRRYDRSPSRSSSPSAPRSSMVKRHSFSRTGGSYPFSSDESSDDLSASSSENADRDGGASSTHGPSSAGGHTSRTRVSSAAPTRAAEPQPYRAPPASGGGRRTMVSSPSTGSAPFRSPGRTAVSSAAAATSASGPFSPQQQPYSSLDDRRSPYGDYDPRDAPSSPYSAPFRPHISPASPPSPSAYHRPQPSQLLSREGPSGFTGFDVRGHEREVDDAEFERDERERERERERRERGRLRQQGMASGSAKRYGEHGAPVGRRMASRLGL
ncbi:hypothetical protein JCM9279_006657 [Rhodotorula babjevae]